ncbi:MAG: type II toxin-antitoxin system prevent-host-death family antitoxin [Desulfurella sp.]|jgi:prevent-host-death family protein
MQIEISANTIKTKGISFINKFIKNKNEIIVSVRGKRKYVILPIEEYERIRDLEIEQAIKKAEDDYNNNRYIAESTEEHFKRIGI